MDTTTKAGAPDILAALAADPNVAPAFARVVAPFGERRFFVDGAYFTPQQMLETNCDDEELCAWVRSAKPGDRFPALVECRCVSRAIRPRPLCDTDEPDYSDEAPIRDDRFADCAAADWLAGRTS